MESNLEDNITQSQSEKNPQKSKGNSRRKKILCKKHETGRKGQNEVNSSENTTLQQQYEKGDISFRELCQAIINQKDKNVERFFANDIEDDINTINSNVNNQNRNDNDKNKDNNDNTHDNVNANNNDNGNDNDDNNDVQQVFPPQNPHLPLSNPNPPYIPPEQPKAISNLDDALNNVLRQRQNTSSNQDESITIEIATKYKDTIHVEDENTIEYQGAIYHPQTDEDGRKYFKIKYMQGERKVYEGKVYLVNTFNQFPGWKKPDDNPNESYVYSQTTYTIWFSQCHYLIMSYGALKVYSLRYYKSISKELSPEFLSTYNGLKHIITHPDEFVLTQDLYNIIFAYANLMYNMFQYYGDSANLGYDLWVHLSHHPMVTREVVENILAVHISAIFTQWYRCVYVKQPKQHRKEMNMFLETVIGYLHQWTIYLKPKITNNSNATSYFSGLFLNDALNDPDAHSRFAVSNLFPIYDECYDKKMDDKEMAQRHVQRYIYKKELEKAAINRAMRYHEVEYEQVWKEMTALLPAEIETLADAQLIQKIKQLDIYNSFINDSMMRVDFQLEEPAYDEMTPAQLFEWIIRRHKFDLQRAFIEGTKKYCERNNLKITKQYFYPSDTFTEDAEAVIEKEIFAKKVNKNRKQVFYVQEALLQLIQNMPENHQVVLFKYEDNAAMKMEQVLNGVKDNDYDYDEENDNEEKEENEEEEEEEEEEEPPQPQTLGRTGGKGKSRGWKVPK